MKEKLKKAAVMIFAASMLAGCSEGERIEESSAEASETVLEETLEIKETASSDVSKEEETLKIKAEETRTDGMECFHRFEFYYGEDCWELCLYAPDDVVEENGELMLDDSCPFLIQAEGKNGSYVFLDETIQLGVPQADVWSDEEERLHITLRDARSACYRIIDFIYIEDKDLFEGKYLVDQQGINYMGTAGGF